jgi:hypothetical protein
LRRKTKIEEPDDEAICEQNEHRGQAWTVPNVPHFEWNQGRGRKYHQPFRPPLLHIDANSFGKKASPRKKVPKNRWLATRRPQGWLAAY